MKAITILTLGSMLLLTGCQSGAVAEPAVLVAGGAEVRQQLNDFITNIVGDNTVTLADDVLQQSPELFIEQRMPLDSQGRPLDGRHQLPSYRFVLVKAGDSCILQHPGSGKSVRLNSARCQTVAR